MGTLKERGAERNCFRQRLKKCFDKYRLPNKSVNLKRVLNMGAAKTITELVSRLFKDTSMIKHSSSPTLCWSGKAVLLGSGLTLSWLQWHLCDRGFLGYVVLHWLLYSGLLRKGKRHRISAEPFCREE